MKVLIFNWRDTKHSYAGGAEVYIHELAKRWVSMGNSVTLFCGNDTHCPRYETVDGIQVIRRGGFYMVYIWAFLYYIFRFRGKFDMIIDCQNGIPFFTPFFAREKKYCLMFHVHQKVFRESLILPLAKIAEYLEGKMMPWAYRKVEFITISNSTKTEMEEIGLGTAGIYIIHPGVDTSSLIPGEKSKLPLIAYLGRLKKYKCVDIFIRAIPFVLAENKNARFIIAGDGEENQKLQKMVKRLKIHDKVEFTGKVTPAMKVEIYQKAWLFINPSLMEGWAMTNIEASACATPVIAADVPGMRDSVKHLHTGLLVKHGDPKVLGEIINIVIKDKVKWKHFSENSVKWAKNFEWKNSALKSAKLLGIH